MKMKRTIGVVTALLMSTASASAIMVYDPTVAAKIVEQIKSEKEGLEKQIGKLKEQIDVSEKIKGSLTGNRGFGDLYRGTDINDYLPKDAGNILDIDANGFKEDISRLLESERLGTGDPKQIREQINKRQRELRALRKVQAKKAYEGSLKRSEQIEKLMDEIKNTEDQKAISELQARIQGEQVALEVENNKIKLLDQLSESEQKLIEEQKNEQSRKQWDPSSGNMSKWDD